MSLGKPQNTFRKWRSGQSFPNYVLAFCILTGALIYLALITQIKNVSIGDPIGARLLPMVIACGLILSAIMLFFETLRPDRTASPEIPDPAGPLRSSKHSYLFLCGIVIIVAAYYAVFNYLGYLISTSIFMLVVLTLLNRGQWIFNIVLSFGFTLLAYICFSKFLTIALPVGFFGF